jgi:hypothetical protein
MYEHRKYRELFKQMSFLYTRGFKQVIRTIQIEDGGTSISVFCERTLPICYAYLTQLFVKINTGYNTTFGVGVIV